MKKTETETGGFQWRGEKIENVPNLVVHLPFSVHRHCTLSSSFDSSDRRSFSLARPFLERRILGRRSIDFSRSITRLNTLELDWRRSPLVRTLPIANNRLQSVVSCSPAESTASPTRKWSETENSFDVPDWVPKRTDRDESLQTDMNDEKQRNTNDPSAADRASSYGSAKQLRRKEINPRARWTEARRSPLNKCVDVCYEMNETDSNKSRRNAKTSIYLLFVFDGIIDQVRNDCQGNQKPKAEE